MKTETETQIELFKSLLECEEMQKENLSTQLHSEILPILVVIKMNLQLLNREKGITPGMQDHMDRNTQVIDNLIERMRVFYYELYPSLIKHTGFVNFIKAELKGIAEQLLCNVQFQFDWEFEKHPISNISQLHLFRLTSQLLEHMALINPKSTIEVNIVGTGGELILDFLCRINSNSKTKTKKANTQNIDSLKARLLLLNGDLDNRTDFENYFKAKIPFETP